MAELDRAGLIELLDRLGSNDDATVLEAARALHRKASEAGLTWDELIRPDREHEPFDAAPAGREGTAGVDAGETGRLIDRLLRKELSDSLREDLTEMKRQLAEHTLDPEDARYVRALARRLGV
jgi:hypothetical protein